jgi:hypothetical protein
MRWQKRELPGIIKKSSDMRSVSCEFFQFQGIIYHIVSIFNRNKSYLSSLGVELSGLYSGASRFVIVTDAINSNGARQDLLQYYY